MSNPAWTLLVAAAAAMVAPARANPVEGSLRAPWSFLPAMTVYARDVDRGHLQSITTSEGQRVFRLELAPGRYTFFAEPSQAGAPPLYGAYTESAVCRARDAGAPCEDHALVVVGIAASPARETPHILIADWALPDELSEEIDHLLGHRTAPSAQELGAPRFSEYPVAASGGSAAVRLDLSGVHVDPAGETRLNDALARPPNFAGEVAVVEIPCGPDCVDVMLIERNSGRVQAPQALAQLSRDLPCRADESILYRRDSRLLSVTHRQNAGILTQYFLWNPRTAALVPTAEYQRPIERFCSLPGS